MHKVLSQIRAYLDRRFLVLAGSRGILLLSLLGLISGLLVGVMVISFRVLIETVQSTFIPGADPENYELLSVLERFLIPGIGALILALLFLPYARENLRLGVIHVMERLSYHEGHLSMRSLLLQFIGGAVAIISGHSVGREGPSIHIGAGSASLMGQWLRMPNNSIRTLVACGTAAAIAASFNTPLAGVIFAMEVVMMEYTISGFTPVILAAVSATALNRLVFVSLPTFILPGLTLKSFWELGLILVMGIAIGALAATFIYLLNTITRHTRDIHVSLRLCLAGLGVGSIAVLVPEVMGIGYDTANAALFGDIALMSLFLILIAKVLATSISVGCGIPAGLIGPCLFMGAVAGAITGQILHLVAPEASDSGLYAMLGMGAMMGATLQAPLAALLALLELTGNIDMVLPAMLAIISANLTSKELFNNDSVYLMQMRSIGLDYLHDPLSQSLRRLAVGSVMSTSFALVPSGLSRQRAEALLAEEKPEWLVIERAEDLLLMPAADLARVISELKPENEAEIDLLEIPSKRLQMVAVRQQATLQQAYNILNETDAEALYVTRPFSTGEQKLYGIVTRGYIENSYRL